MLCHFPTIQKLLYVLFVELNDVKKRHSKVWLLLLLSVASSLVAAQNASVLVNQA